MTRLTLRRILSLRYMALAACNLLALLAGCSIPTIPGVYTRPEPPLPKVNSVLVSWDNHVHVTSDSVNQGAPLRGLAGRVYLFGEDNKSADATGMFAVELFDMTPAAAGGQPKKLADWKFDPETLKQLKKKDMIGDGYTLFLPWENYRPEITQVRLQLAYVPLQGTPNYTDPEIVTLRTDSPSVTLQSNQVVPAAYRSDKK